MKVLSKFPVQNKGNVLVVTLVLAAVMGVTLASFLALTRNQMRSVARSKHWNQTLVVAEAGIEEALQMVNKHVATPVLTNWVNTYYQDNWTKNGNIYTLTRSMTPDKSVYYEVTVTNLNPNVNDLVGIRSVGYLTLPAALGNNVVLTRTVVVEAQISTLFNVAMAAKGAIDLKGNGVATDSFDSSSTNYSSNGLYDPLKRKAGGDVATNNTLTNSAFTVGNANIAGHIFTGPYGTYSIGPNGTVGDLLWVATRTGVKPGWDRNDMNVIFEDVSLPSTSWLSTGAVGYGGAGTAPDGNYYDHVFNSSGDYWVPDSGSIYVGTNVNIRIHSTAGTFSPTKIYVAGDRFNSGNLATYLAGTKAVLDTDHVIQSGVARHMAFFGLPSVTSIDYNGNGDFTGTIYAPQAIFSLNGGGVTAWDFIGSSVTMTVQMNGKYHFHYDEDLKKRGPDNGYIPHLWKEI